MKGWLTKPLGEVATFERGLTYSKTDEVPYSRNGVLRANNIDLATKSLDLTDIRYIANSVQVPPTKKVKKGCLIICTASGSRSHLGKVAFIDDDYDLAFGGFMGLITAGKDLEERFLYYLLTSGKYIEKLDSLAGGTNINNLKFKDIADFPVPLPPLEEQRRIVAVLDEAFAAIATATANAGKNLANVDDLFASILAHALHEEARGWETRELQAILQAGRKISYGIVKPGNHDANGIRLIKSQQVRDGYMDLSADFRITKALDAEYARTRLCGGEILLNLVGASIGRSAVAPLELAGANVSRAIAVIPVRDDLVPWVQYNLRGFVGQQLIQARTGGAAQPVLNLSEVKALPVALPPISQRDAIVRRLDALSLEVFSLTAIYRQEIDALIRLRQSLLHRAFTGKLTAAMPETIAA